MALNTMRNLLVDNSETRVKVFLLGGGAACDLICVEEGGANA
jgi:hypothetical protein